MHHLYIMRHGESGPAPGGFPDSSRTLTPCGMQQVKTLAVNMERRDVEPEVMIASPYTRARQTAALVNNQLNAELKFDDGLVPGGDPETVLDSIAGIEEDLFLVSHMPLVGALTQALTGEPVAFHQGTVVKIMRQDSYARSGKLVWTLNPEARPTV